MKIRFGLIAATAALLTAMGTAPVSAGHPYGCTYSSADAGVVTVDLITTDYALIYVDEGGEIVVHFDLQAPPDTDCGDATTSNTSLITVLGTDVNDLIVIDDQGPGGPFPTDIEMDLRGRDGADRVWFWDTDTGNTYRFGVAGGVLAGDRDGTGNPTLTFRSVQEVLVDAAGGRDILTGSPGGAFDGPYSGRLTLFGEGGVDKLVGGSARDYMEGGNRGDDLRGKAGADDLRGGYGDDALDGGPGEDSCQGGPGDDTKVNCELAGGIPH